MEIVSWKDKLTQAVGNDFDKRVTLTHREKTSVYTHTGEGTDMALKELGSYHTLAETVAVQPFTSRGACDVIDSLRDESLIGGYYRGSGEFSDHLAGVFQQDGLAYNEGWVEVEMDRMDHKRAMATVTCTVNTNVKTVLEAGDNQLFGWTAEVYTDLGRLEIEC